MFMSNHYRTGYVEHISESFARQWINAGAYDSGPHWHRTPADTEHAIALALAVGNTVTRLTR